MRAEGFIRCGSMNKDAVAGWAASMTAKRGRETLFRRPVSSNPIQDSLDNNPELIEIEVLWPGTTKSEICNKLKLM